MKTRSVSGRPTAVLRYRHLEKPAVPIVVTEHGVEFELVELDGCDVEFGGVYKSATQVTVRSEWVSSWPPDDTWRTVSAPLCKGQNTGIKAALVCGCVWLFFVLIVVLVCLAEV